MFFIAIGLVISIAVIAKAFEVTLPESPLTKLIFLSKFKITGARATSRNYLTAGGYVVSRIYSGYNCDKEPVFVQGMEINTCLVAVDAQQNPVGSVIYELNNIKLTTSEFATFDCCGSPISIISAVLPVNKCFTYNESGISVTADIITTPEPWKNIGKGMNWLYYDSQVTCEQSPQNPSIFNWIPDSHCYPANIGVGNTPGGLQYTSCSANTYTIVGYADVNCTQLLHSYEEIPRPICVIGEYGNDHDDDAVQDSSHVDDYETLTCNV